MKTLRAAVFLSGSGTTLDYFVEHFPERFPEIQLALVVTDRHCKGIDKAHEYGLHGIYVYMCAEAQRDITKREGWNKLLVEQLKRHAIDLVLFAGFMRIVGKPFTDEYKDKILNIHPGHLPLLAGKDPQKKALALNLGITGNTVHIVSDIVDDSSNILATDVVTISEDDTEASLSQKLLEVSYETYMRGIDNWITRYLEYNIYFDVT